MLTHFLRAVAVLTLLFAALVAVHFPFGVDGPAVRATLIEDADQFYEAAYTDPGDGTTTRYVEIAQTVAHHDDIQPKLRRFLEEFELQKAKTLEVGAGSGTLQDVVDDYTGLDIAASAARYFHKPFVHGSATELPFEDNKFDLAWSIWTFEHVPNPEQGFREIRRVVRTGGYLYLYPAWNNPTWAPQGYPLRRDSDLNWQQIAVKYSLLVREMSWFKKTYRYPIRLLRKATVDLEGGPSQLRYRKVDANFDTYWMPDSDAVNSIDCYEARLWFQSRGDHIVHPDANGLGIFGPCGPLVVRVSKDESSPSDKTKPQVISREGSRAPL